MGARRRVELRAEIGVTDSSVGSVDFGVGARIEARVGLGRGEIGNRICIRGRGKGREKKWGGRGQR